jgi:LemA protein
MDSIPMPIGGILMLMIGIFAAVVALVFAWSVSVYNRFVRLRNLMAEAWSGIDVQLKRRVDLVPNLVETVKGYAGHEKELFEKIAASRAQSVSAGSVREQAAAESALTASLRTLFAVAEAYPELKANTNFLELQKSLAEIEDQVQMARRYYNGTVRENNVLVDSFPSNLVARLSGFAKADFFELEDDAERKAPQVRFN